MSTPNDAVINKKVKLEDLKDDQLPAELKKMSKDERAAYIAKKSKARNAIRAEITKLNAARKKYVAAEMKKRAGSKKDSLDEAMLKSIRKQAEKRSFRFGKDGQ